MINPRGTISQALANLKAKEGVSLSIRALAEQLDLSKDLLYRLDNKSNGLIYSISTGFVWL
ncbi:MAG: hypothetical protein DPW09_43950 [Anaerolineae bacterium]|nr:hypothetical protein [Anaerolineae bacterium]